MIEIVKGIKTESGFILAYTENVLIFRDSDLSVDKATISSFGYSITLYPAPDNLFYFYASEFANSLINDKEDNFDYVPTDASDSGDDLLSVFSFRIGTYKNATLVSEKHTESYKFLKSDDLSIVDKNKSLLLPDPNITCYKGYPFEYAYIENGEVRRKVVTDEDSINESFSLEHPNMAKSGTGKLRDELVFFDWSNYNPALNENLSTFEIDGVVYKAELYTDKNEDHNTYISSQKLHENAALNKKYNLHGDKKFVLEATLQKTPAHTVFALCFQAFRKDNDRCVPTEWAIISAMSPYQTTEDFEAHDVSIDCGDGAYLAEQDPDIALELCGNGNRYAGFQTGKISDCSTGVVMVGARVIKGIYISVNTHPGVESVIKPLNMPRLVFAARIKKKNTFLPPASCKFVDKCGIYLKWLNGQGAYSYHLFEHDYIRGLSVKSKGVVRSANKRVLEIGRKKQRTRKIQTRVHVSQISLIESLIDSQEIYLYKSERFSNTHNWERVRLAPEKYEYAVKKDNIVEFRLTLIRENIIN